MTLTFLNQLGVGVVIVVVVVVGVGVAEYEGNSNSGLSLRTALKHSLSSQGKDPIEIAMFIFLVWN